MSKFTPSALKMPDFRGDSSQRQSRHTKHDEGSADSTPSRNTDSNPRGLRSMTGLLGGLGRRKDQPDLTATLDENRYLHEKFESAKEDFQAQTSELMRELTKVYGEKDELEKERDDLRSQLTDSESMSSVLVPSTSRAQSMVPREPCSGAPPLSDADYCIGGMTELERLKAETIVLSRALAVSRGETTLGPQRRCSDAPPDASSLSSLIEQHLETGLAQLRANVDAEVETSPLPPAWATSKRGMADALLACLLRFAVPSAAAAGGGEGDARRRAPLPPDVELEAAAEECNLLRAKLHEMAAEHGGALHSAQAEASKWRRKAAGKQQTLVKVQAEKESMYGRLREASASADELRADGERLQGELSYLQGRLLTRSDGAAQVLDGLRDEIVDLQEQLAQAKRSACAVDAAGQRGGGGIDDERVACLEGEVSDMRAERGELLAKLDSVEQIALSRKLLADELAIESQDLAGQLAGQMRSSKASLEEKDGAISALQRTVDELERIREAVASMERLQEELCAAHESCGLLRQELDDKDRAHSGEVDALQESLAAAEERCASLNGEVETARERVAEADAMVMIADRKAAATLKDMKHQLTLESKRVSRLQQELQAVQAEQEEAAAAAECMAAEANVASLARMPVQMVRRMTSLSTAKLEELLSSLGNLSVADGATSARKRSSSETGPSTGSSTGSDSVLQPCPATRDTGPRYLYKSFSELEAIIHALRAEKQGLEERVHHLEENAAGMAEELLEKSAILRSCVGKDVASSTVKRSPSMFSPSGPANLFRRLTLMGDGSVPPPDVHAAQEDSEGSLLRRRVEEGIIKITHLEQTVRDLMAEREILQTERHGLLQCGT